MKFASFVSVGLSFALLLSPLTGNAALQHGTPPADVSREVLREVNRVRTNPQAYADFLTSRRALYREDGMMESRGGRTRFRTHEGVRALDEAIRCLRRTQPLPPLTFCAGLASSARDHAQDQGHSGLIGHNGRDGSDPFARMERYGAWRSQAGENIAYGPLSAEQIVVNLVVDDGVPGRGHRNNVLKPAFGVAGVGVGAHPRYGRVCVIDFAGDFVAR